MERDRHPHEDRLAAWVLDGGEPLSESERAHVEGCALRARRLAALRRLAGVLEEIRVDAPARPARAGGLAALAMAGTVAALLAALVPGTGPSPRPGPPAGSWAVVERAAELYRRYPAEMVDSLALAVVEERQPLWRSRRRPSRSMRRRSKRPRSRRSPGPRLWGR